MPPITTQTQPSVRPKSANRVVDSGFDDAQGKPISLLVTGVGSLKDDEVLNAVKTYGDANANDLIAGKAKMKKMGKLTIYPSPEPTSPDDLYPTLQKAGRKAEMGYQNFRNMILPDRENYGNLVSGAVDLAIPPTLPGAIAQGASIAIPALRGIGAAKLGIGGAASTIGGRLGQEVVDASIPPLAQAVTSLFTGEEEDIIAAGKNTIINTGANLVLGRLIGMFGQTLEARVGAKFQDDLAKVLSKPDPKTGLPMFADEVTKSKDLTNSVLQLGHKALNDNLRETGDRLIDTISTARSSGTSARTKAVFLGDDSKEAIKGHLDNIALNIKASFETRGSDKLPEYYKAFADNLQGIKKEITALNNLSTSERGQFIRHIFNNADDDFKKAVMSAIDPNDPVQASALSKMRLHDIFPAETTTRRVANEGGLGLRNVVTSTSKLTGAANNLEKQQIERRIDHLWYRISNNVQNHIYNQLDYIIQRDLNGRAVFDMFRAASEAGTVDQQLLQTYLQTRGKAVSAKNETLGEIVNVVFRGSSAHKPDYTAVDKVAQGLVRRAPFIGRIARELSPILGAIPGIAGTNFSGSISNVPRLSTGQAVGTALGQSASQRVLDKNR